MPVSVAAMTASHHWATTIAYAALYRPTSVDDGTPVEVDRTILDVNSNPIYLRRPVAFTVETPGMLSMATSTTFGVPAGTTVAWYGLLNTAGTLLSLEPISASVLSNVPQPILFNDLAAGWGYKPGGSIGQQGAGSYVVFWSGHGPSSTLYSIGAYTTLPSNIWSQGAYAIWPVRDQQSERLMVNDIVGLSSRAIYDADALIPSNRGWGFWQRIDPVEYVADGTYTLSPGHVRTVG